MGLHLNYELRLPATNTDEQIAERLEALRTFAAELPFDEVSPVVRAHSAELPTARPWPAAIAFHASIIAEPWDEDAPALTGDVGTAQGFLVNPGQGCETAFFGFLRRADDAGGHSEWYWHCSCKTQYASTVSDVHLVTCHTSLVRLLDHASTLGVDVIVRDETFYWETRDVQRLISETHRMNRIVAAFAGKMSDVFGNGHSLRAPIFDHPRFERLEMGNE
jgi:hypothetical protein